MNNISLGTVWFLIIVVEGAIQVKQSCREQCEDRNIRCSHGVMCKVKYDHAPISRVGRPRPLPDSFSVEVMCHQQYNDTAYNVGIEMSWKINGQSMGKGQVEQFHITITDISEMSSTAEAFLMITPNTNTRSEGNVSFAYYYTGDNEEKGPKINPNGRYMITLESVPIYRQRKDLLPRKIRKRIMVPRYFKEEECGNETMKPSAPIANTDIPTWLVVTAVLSIIFMVVAVVALAAFIWKRRQDADEAMIAAREHRILVLLNVDDKAEVAKQTNWTATALSRVKKMGGVTVKYNRWEATRISENGIVKWLDEMVSWANKIIISSTPDDLRNESTAQVFEQALENIMLQYASMDEEQKDVFIIYFDDKENHRDCPYMNGTKYRKFRLDDQWTSLCRSILGYFSVEQEPLYVKNVV